MSGFGTRDFPEAKPEDGWRYQVQEKVKSAELQVADMEKFGIGKHVISMIAVSCNTDWAEPEDAAAMNRHANEMNASWVQKYPDRFIGSFTMPLQDIGLAMKEFEYAQTSSAPKSSAYRRIAAAIISAKRNSRRSGKRSTIATFRSSSIRMA